MGVVCVLTVGVLAYLFLPELRPVKYEAPRFNNLGSYQRKITTAQPAAQKFFNQGLILFYGFQWGESLRSFKEAARLDPECALCHWGVALSLYHKVNEPDTGHEYEEGKSALDLAQAHAVKATPVEQELIQALAQVYQHPPIIQKMESAFSCHESNTQKTLSSAQDKLSYLAAMKNVLNKYPNDPDLQSIYALGLWVYVGGTNPAADNPMIVEATQVLKSGLENMPEHPGLNHMIIHLTEPYSQPGQALPSADRLNTLVPGSEHLVHMPSHVYFLTGRYHQGSEANLQAIKVYKQYNKTTRDQGFEPVVNYLYFHNYDFLRSTASMEGNKTKALQAAHDLVQEPFPTWLKSSSALQWFIPIPYFVELRFGLWQDVLKHPKPEDKYAYAQGMWHYAQGVALAQTNQLQASHSHAAALQNILKAGAVDANLGERGVQLLSIAASVLYANLADKQNEPQLLFDHLTYAAKVQDTMPYHEPPDWYFPIRQALGDAYMKWGYFDRAQFMYELDLAQYPMNGWSVYGFEQSLRAQGQGPRADTIHPYFEQSWQHADIPLPVSLFPYKKD